MDIAHLRKLDFSLLLIFRAVMKHRQLTLAADDVGLTQSALSHALRRLSAIVGEPLFERRQYGVEPTNAAFALIGPVETILSVAENALGMATPFDPATTTKVFTIAVGDVGSTLFAAPLSAALAKTAPGAALKFKALTPQEKLKALADGTADLAITTMHRTPEGYRAEPVFHGGMVGIAQKAHPILRKVSVKKFTGASHVTYPQENSALETTLEGLGRARTVAAEVPNIVAAVDLVGQSQHIAIAPAAIIARRTKRGGVRSFDLPFDLPPFSLSAVTHSRRDGDTSVAMLKDLVAKVGRKLAAQ